MLFSVLLLSLCFAAKTFQRSTPADSSYVAAVLEYQVNSNRTLNLLNYVQHIQDAAAQNADIVVFPEMTLSTGASVEVPINGLLQQYPVPALNPELYHEILVDISAAARANAIYVVINVQESMNCSSASEEYCPEARVYLFNTNVVFDRSGAVIDRYRKINLFGEYTRNPALQPDLGVFSTDFGVTFGHFICFDLMFQVPAVQVVEKHNLTDIIFSTMWFSELPYLTAVQIQEAYAYAMNVNFIASGANNVRVGSAGSGIYSGKAGALISIMPGKPTTRLLVATVPKTPGQVTNAPGPIYDPPQDHDDLALITDPSLPAHVSRPLVNGAQEFTLVDKDVSCRFRIRLNQTGEENVLQYRAFVHDGTNTYSRRQVGVAACSLVACQNLSARSCGYRPKKSNTVIEELSIEMSSYRVLYNNTLHCDDVVYYPSSLTIQKFPLAAENFTLIETRQDGGSKQNGGRERVSYKLNAPQNELLSFGVWGRIYNRDINFDKVVTEDDIQRYIDIENDIYGQVTKTATD